jgi:hypothetical protein
VGDFITLINSFHIGTVNTILLTALGYVLQSIFSRIKVMEQQNVALIKSIAYIKGHLNIEEEA